MSNLIRRYLGHPRYLRILIGYLVVLGSSFALSKISLEHPYSLTANLDYYVVGILIFVSLLIRMAIGDYAASGRIRWGLQGWIIAIFVVATAVLFFSFLWKSNHFTTLAIFVGILHLITTHIDVLEKPAIYDNSY